MLGAIRVIGSEGIVVDKWCGTTRRVDLADGGFNCIGGEKSGKVGMNSVAFALDVEAKFTHTQA
jgi:hypothetical protein